jgi:hypothetical protein
LEPFAFVCLKAPSRRTCKHAELNVGHAFPSELLSALADTTVSSIKTFGIPLPKKILDCGTSSRVHNGPHEGSTRPVGNRNMRGESL